MDDHLQYSWQGRRVVLCDEGLTLLFMCHLLPRAGLSVVGTATRGGDLIELVRRESPDLIITDDQMCDMERGDLVARLCAVSSACLVLLSTDTERPADEAGAAHVSGVLHKPLDGAALVSRLYEAWERYAGAKMEAASAGATIQVHVEVIQSGPDGEDLRRVFQQATESWETAQRSMPRLAAVVDCSHELCAASRSLRAESRMLREAIQSSIEMHARGG